MKPIILLLIPVFSIFGIHAQSKKAINQQLKIELAAVQKTADSIESFHGDKQREIKYLRNGITEAAEVALGQMREGDSYRSDIRNYHVQLKELGFDANTVISLSEADALVAPVKENKLSDKMAMTQFFELVERPVMEDLTEVKTKVQNEILRTSIAELREINDGNKRILSAEQDMIKSLTEIKVEFIKVVLEYGAFNKDLLSKVKILKTKYLELKKIKDEQDRLKLEKELALENKKKGKEPKTVEPVVMDKNYDSEEYFSERDTKQDEDFDSEYGEIPPPLPPPVVQPETPVILDVVEQQAEFPGGREALVKFLDANLKMPEVAKEMGVNGRCYLKFVISEAGNISNVKVVKGVNDCPECDKEALRVVKSMPNWIPAKNKGKAVNCWYTLPILFNVQ